MLYLISCATIFITLVNISKRKKNYFFILILLLIISIGNNNNADYFAYERIYNNLEYSKVEIGFSFLMTMGKGMGMSYHVFAAFIYVIGFALILLSLKKVPNINYILLCYLFYSFLLDMIQIRFFLSVTIFLYSIRYLMGEGKKNIFKYIVSVLIATSIHTTSLFYLIFLLLKVRYSSLKRSIFFLIVLISFSMFLIVLVNNKQFPLINQFLTIIDKPKYIEYFKSQVDLGFVIPILLYTGSLVLLQNSIEILKKRNANIQDLRFSKLVLGMHIVSSVVYPFLLINLQFIRFYRSITILKYAVFAITDDYLPRKTQTRYIYNIKIILFILLNFILELVLQDRFTRVFVTIFENNIFFSR